MGRQREMRDLDRDTERTLHSAALKHPGSEDISTIDMMLLMLSCPKCHLPQTPNKEAEMIKNVIVQRILVF